MKILSELIQLKLEKRHYLSHSWSDKGLKGIFVNLVHEGYVKLQRSSFKLVLIRKRII